MQACKCNKRRSVILRTACAISLAATMWLGSGQAFAAAPPSIEFDWSVTNGPGNGGDANEYTPAPILTDQSVPYVIGVLGARYASNHNLPLAIKVTGPISNTTAKAIFDNFNVKYVFADLEAGGTSQIQALVNQVRADSLSKSKSAFIGNFNYYPYTGTDLTRPKSTGTGAASFTHNPSGAYYGQLKLNMTNESAYPGSPDFNGAGPAGAPNIRSALFILPVDRVTYGTTFLATKGYSNNFTGQSVVKNTYGGQNIPWIARFDNWGNNLLNNDGNNALGPLGSAGNPSLTSAAGYQYAFNTNDPSHPEYKNQLLSAGDFSAQVLQYRLRGATSFNLFNYASPFASVIGYSDTQEQKDATSGWNGGGNSTLSAIWGRNNFAYANLVNMVPLLKTTGSGKSLKTSEVNTSAVQSGMVLSGIYDLAGTTRDLALLLSNMSSTSQTVDFVEKYGGASVNLAFAGSGPLDQYYSIAPGTHELLQFSLTNGKWVLFANDEVFADSNRNGIGVPEPTSLALLGLTGVGLLLRRRRAVV